MKKVISIISLYLVIGCSAYAQTSLVTGMALGMSMNTSSNTMLECSGFIQVDDVIQAKKGTTCVVTKK